MMLRSNRSNWLVRGLALAMVLAPAAGHAAPVERVIRDAPPLVDRFKASPAVDWNFVAVRGERESSNAPAQTGLEPTAAAAPLLAFDLAPHPRMLALRATHPLCGARPLLTRIPRLLI